MNPIREIAKAIRATLTLWLLVAIIYPFSILAISQLALPYQANGSPLTNPQGKILGSALIGQPFTSDRYFNSRPSSTSYSTADPKQDTAGVLKTGVSGATNLAPTNPALLDRINGKTDPDPKKAILVPRGYANAGDLPRLQQAGIKPTADLLYTSGSSLDPHITPAAARAQIQRIATVRKLPTNRVELLIVQHTDDRALGIFGEPGVNVLKLNLALDALR